MTGDLSIAERRRIVLDLAHWRDELAMAGSEDFDADALTKYCREMLALDDAALRNAWVGSVGEWVLSRHDIEVPDDFDAWLDEQYENVTAGNPVPWGYVTTVVDIPLVEGQRVRLTVGSWESTPETVRDHDGEEGVVSDVLDGTYAIDLDGGPTVSLPSHKLKPVNGRV